MNHLKVNVICQSSANANTYVVGSLEKCIIIDPANDVRVIEKMVDGRNVCGIFLTHGHYDHFKDLKKVLEKYLVKIYMHKKANLKLHDCTLSYANHFGCQKPLILQNEQIQFVNDGDKIDFEDFVSIVHYKPGHTDCSIVLEINNFLFTGDLLFKESVGRTDLLTGSVLAMNRSLEEIKKLSKKQDYLVFPGHDDSTTLSAEIKNNNYLLRK